MMDISTQPAAERIARVLAGKRISANADGDAESASREVEARWKDYLPDAAAVMRTLREPDSAMAEPADPAPGSGPCRERVCQSVQISGVAASLQQKYYHNQPPAHTTRSLNLT